MSVCGNAAVSAPLSSTISEKHSINTWSGMQGEYRWENRE